MLFKGTTNRTWKQISDETKEHGIYKNANTYYERILYYATSAKYSFEPAVSILSDMIKNSTFPQEELEKERGAIVNEVMSYNDNLNNVLKDHVMATLFAGKPPSLPVAGTLESVRNISRDRLIEIYKASNTPDNTVVVAYGDLDKKSALRTLSKYFSDFEGKSSVRKVDFDVEKPTIRESVLRRAEISQARGALQFVTPGREKLNAYDKSTVKAFDCVSDILRKRLFEEIRQKRGLVYSIYPSFFEQRSFGIVGVDFSCEPSKTDEVKALALKEIEKLRAGELSKADLNQSKKTLLWAASTVLDNTSFYSELLAEHGITYGNIPNTSALRALKLEDLFKAADTYLNTDDAIYFLMLPKGA